MTPNAVEDVVGRLSPNAVVDHVPGLAVSLCRATGEPTLAERLNEWIVRNNALKAEAASLLRTQAERIAELERDRDELRREAGELVVAQYATAAAEAQLSTAQSTIERYREALEEAKGALEEAEDRDNRARFRANSPRQDVEVKHLRTSAIRHARSVLEGKE